jgi:SPP1 gp7 family putative phage head morphogenesis protein
MTAPVGPGAAGPGAGWRPDRDPPQEALAAALARGADLREIGSWLELYGEEHRRAFTVAQTAGYSVLEDIWRAWLDAFKAGMTPRDFTLRLRPLLIEKGWWGRAIGDDGTPGPMRGSSRRLKLIFETNMRVSHAAGAWARFERQKAARPYLRYVAVKDDRTRASHLALHDLCLHVDDPAWNMLAPPNGFNCRCTLQSLSQRDVDALVKAGTKLRLEAPDLTFRPFVNRVTGEIRRIPDGVDPGWDYNPGRVPTAPAPTQPRFDRGGQGLLFGPLPETWPGPPDADELQRRSLTLHEGQTVWHETLGTDALNAIEDYKGYGNTVLNRLRRGLPLDENRFDDTDIAAAEELGRVLDDALADVTLPNSLTTWRGIERKDAGTLLSLKPGDTFLDPGFASSSLSLDVARRFGDVIIEIRMRRGTRGAAYIHFIPDVNEVEYEVLLVSNTRFHVVSNEAGRLIVEVVAA